MKKILWLSENSSKGKTPRDFVNMRTEFAWFVASDGTHEHIGELPKIGDNSFDIAIIILPKRQELLQQMSTYMGFDLVGQMRRVAKKIGWMQEGSVTYFQDYQVGLQVWWFSVLNEMDFVMVHNEKDVKYIQGLVVDKPVFVNRALMIEDSIKNIQRPENPAGTIIGGNFVGWYGGFDSYITALEYGETITAPSMGRMPQDEGSVNGLEHLPYMSWVEWMNKLAEFKYAVHLMPTQAAGTFALNCAFLGIPCIGYKGLDTQGICFPATTVDMLDLSDARKTARTFVKSGDDDYRWMSNASKNNYQTNFSEEVWKTRFFNFIETIYSKESII